MVVRLFVCLSFVFLCLCTVESRLIKTTHHCIPTSIVRGPCHTCVCMVDGLFHCRSEPCNKVQSNVESNNVEQDCQPGMTYNYKTLYCHCNEKGQWKSANCKINATRRSHNNLPEIKDGQPCTPGKAYKMECNSCWCTNSGNLICTKMGCMEHLRSKKNGPPELPKLDCEPGKLYKKGCQKCFCTDMKIPVCNSKHCKRILKSGANTVNSIRSPADVMPPVDDNEFGNLPKVLHGAADCNPGGTYRWDCNVCVCMADGNLFCEQNYCLHMGESNRVAAKRISGKLCNETHPSEDECITCTCDKSGRHSCTPLTDCVPASARRQLHGSHEKIKPRLPFDIHKDTCVPYMVYRIGCNNCYCQKDFSLRCTRKGCLNKSQVKELVRPGETEEDETLKET